MNRRYPIVIPADGRYVVDFGEKAIPQFHEVIKENGTAICNTCKKIRHRPQCIAVVAVRKYIQAGGQRALPSPKPQDRPLESIIDGMRQARSKWVMDNSKAYNAYWNMILHGTRQEQVDYLAREGIRQVVIG